LFGVGTFRDEPFILIIEHIWRNNMAIGNKTSVSTKKQAKAADKPEIPNNAEREQWIKESAYFMAESRGFIAGHEQEDWNIAANQYDSSLSSVSL
jgi:hypothetical protein